MPAPSTASSVSSGLAAIREAAQPPPATPRDPGGRPCRLQRTPGVTFHNYLDRLPDWQNLRKSSDADAALEVAKALAKFQKVQPLLERAADFRYAAEAVDGLKALGLQIEPELESRAWFRITADDAAAQRANGESHVRRFFMDELERTVRPIIRRVTLERAAALRTAFEEAKRSDGEFRRRWPSAASNDDLFLQIAFEIDSMEFDASKEPLNLEWHYDLRVVLQGPFSIPLPDIA